MSSKKLSDENILFIEAIEALKNIDTNINIYTIKESKKIIHEFESLVPIVWSRIDWKKITKKCTVNCPEKITPALDELVQQPIETTILLLWNDASIPVVKTTLEAAIACIDDITAVAFETWLWNIEQKYVIELYYLGEITAGLLSSLSTENSI